jgi:hypothetical protein
MTITARKTRPTTSIALMTSRPSSAEVFASGTTGATLPDQGPVVLERPLRLRARPPDQPRVLAAAERGRRRRPRLAVPGKPVRAQLGAQGDQRGEVAHGLDRPGLGDADETVRVQVVAEQQRRVGIGRLEQPRPPVVEQVALVDRLEAEPVPFLGQRREDRLPPGSRAQGLLPEAALLRRLARDCLPKIRRYSQPASSFVQ